MSTYRKSLGTLAGWIAALVVWIASSTAFGQVTVSLPELEGVSGDPFTAGVHVTDLTGLDVSGYQFEVRFNPSILQISGISTDGTLSSGLTTLSNSPEPGRFRAVGVGTTPLTGSGVLINLVGTYAGGGESDLAWAEFVFDKRTVVVTLGAGSASVTGDPVTPPPPPNGDVAVSLPNLVGVTGEPLDFPVTVTDLTGRGISGYQFEVQYDPAVLQITGIKTAGTLSSGLTTLANNPVPGRIRVVGAGTTPLAGAGALIRLRGTYVAAGPSGLTWNEFAFDNTTADFSLAPGSVVVNDPPVATVPVSLGMVSGRPGEEAFVPLTSGDLGGLYLRGFSFAVDFDPAVVEFTGVQTAGTMSAGRSVTLTPTGVGQIGVAGNGSDLLEGAGTLLYLRLRFLAPGWSTLDVSAFTFDRAEVTADAADGQAVTSNAAPQFTSTPIVIARSGVRYEYAVTATDADLDPIVLAAPQKPSWLAFQDNGNGTGLLYGTPGEGAVGVHDVVLTAADVFGVTAIQRFSLSVTANSPPVAVNDQAATAKLQPVLIDVLANDSDPEGASLTIVGLGPVTGGTAELPAGGGVLFTPAAGFAGATTFTYQVSDGLNASQATVTVTVPNADPIAVNDGVEAVAGEVVTIPVLANDSDPDGDTVSLTGVGAPTGGVAVQNADGTISYTAEGDFAGLDTFSYTIGDGYGGTATAVVTVSVEGPGVDGDGVDDPVEDAGPNEGDGNGDGTPDADQSNVATLPIVDGPNAGSYVTLESPEGTFLTEVLSVPNPSPGDAPEGMSFPLGFLSFRIEGMPAGGSVVLTVHLPAGVGVTGYFKYGPTAETPAPHWYDFYYDGTTGVQFAGTVATLTFVDGQRGDGDLAANAIVVEPGAFVFRPNQVPVAVDDAATVDEDSQVTVPVLANDFDTDGTPVWLVDVGAPAHGTATSSFDGTVTYTPEADFFGSDAFTYTITDGVHTGVAATVSIQVLAVNDPPVAVDDVAATSENASVLIPVLANDSDPDGVVALEGWDDPENGTVSRVADGIVMYAPDLGFFGTDSWTYRITDGEAIASATVTVTVEKADHATVANADFGETVEHEAVTLDLLTNDVAEHGEPMSLVSFTQPEHGVLAQLDPRCICYTPSGHWYGTDTFQYTMTDGTHTATAEVTIVVQGVNDPPVFPGDGYLVTPVHGEPVILTGDPDDVLEVRWAAAADADGDAVQYRFQVSRTDSFAPEALLLDLDAGTTTMLGITEGELAGLLTQGGVAEGSMVDLYARVLAGDGFVTIPSATNFYPVIRGSMTGVGTPDELPSEVQLDQNYPNPFNPSTTIRYALPDSGPVSLVVFDMLGSRVATLAEGTQPAGWHEVGFHAEDLPSGVYLYRLTVGVTVITRSLLLVR